VDSRGDVVKGEKDDPLTSWASWRIAQRFLSRSGFSPAGIGIRAKIR